MRALSGVLVVLWAFAAQAGRYDISVRGLGRPQSNQLTDPAVQRFRALSNELALALAPKPLTPAETLGMDGFAFSLTNSVTPISSDADYWQGQPGSPIFEGVQGDNKIPKVFWTPTLSLRKGLPLSTEIAATGTYLAFSNMFNLGADLKLAWHEQFFRWAPSLAGRLAFSRLFGSTDLDIITGEADALLSLPFGIGGMTQLTPFLGYGQVFVHVNSQVIDETPYDVGDPTNDQLGGARGSLYNFPTIEWQDNSHGRAVVGVRLITAFIEVLYELDYVLVDGPANLQTHSFKLGLDV